MGEPLTNPWRGWVWAVFAAFVAHNIEEGVAVTGLGLRLPHLVPLLAEPTPGQFIAALATVTLIALLITTAATRTDRPALAAPLAMVMLINVVAPHALASALAHGYCPGVVTAIAINAPLTIAFLRRLRADGLLPTRVLVGALAGAVGALAVGLPALLRLLTSH